MNKADRHIWQDKSEDGATLVARCGYELDLTKVQEFEDTGNNCEKCLKSLLGERDKAEAAHAKKMAKEAKKQAEAEA